MHTNRVERETETDRVLGFLTSHQASRIPSWLQKETDTKRQSERKTEGESQTERQGEREHTHPTLATFAQFLPPSLLPESCTLFCSDLPFLQISQETRFLRFVVIITAAFPSPILCFQSFCRRLQPQAQQCCLNQKTDTQGNSEQHCMTYSAALGLAVTTSHSHSYTLALQG